MTRLTPQQRQVLNELACAAYFADGVMSTERLAQLTGRSVTRTTNTLYSLWPKGLVERDEDLCRMPDQRWVITQAGRDTLL